MTLFVLILSLVMVVKAVEFCDPLVETYHQSRCLRLINLKLDKKVASCLGHQMVDLVCLTEILTQLVRLYTQDSMLLGQYHLSIFKKASSLDVWRRLVRNYLIESKIDTNDQLNVFVHLFSVENHIYIRNQPIKENTPFIMIHSTDDHQSGDKCIFGQKENSTEKESFQFYSGDCYRTLPFVCVKPLPTTGASRCSTFRYEAPGGNWIDCDELKPIFSVSSNGDEDHLFSDSQKCCMYNINWKQTFVEAALTCSKFDSHVFSYKTRGYETTLENYASFLNLNYGIDSRSSSSSSMHSSLQFWTSCKPGESYDMGIPMADDGKCIEDELSFESAENYTLSTGFKNNFEVIAFSLSNQTRLEQIHFDLTRIYATLQDISNNFELKRIDLPDLKNSSSDCLSAQDKTACLIKDFELLAKNSVFLGERNIGPFHSAFHINLIRTRKPVGNIKEEGSRCFSIYELEDQLVHLSVPFMSKCFHFSLIKLDQERANFSQMSTDLLYRPFVYNSEKINVDMPLGSSMQLSELYGLLSILDIIEISCMKDIDYDETQNRSYLFIGLDTSSRDCRLYTIDKMNKYEEERAVLLREQMIKFNRSVLILHSFSYMRKILRLNCAHTGAEMADLIDKCKEFYDGAYCMFECLSNCSETSENVWQTRPWVYLMQSSICKAALHSNMLTDRHVGVLFTQPPNKTHSLKYYLNNNGIKTHLWHPFDSHSSTGQVFHFRSFNLKQTKSRSSHLLVLVKAVHLVTNQTGSISLRVFHSKEYTDLKFSHVLYQRDELSFYRGSNQIISHRHLISRRSNMIEQAVNLTVENNFNKLNSFLELRINSDMESVKFPINIINSDWSSDYFTLNTFNTIRFYMNTTRVIKPVQLVSSRALKCRWMASNLALNQTKCRLDLSSHINYEQELFDKNLVQDVIVYPSLVRQSHHVKYIRVLYLKKRRECENGGEESESNGCVCLPGFDGKRCEKVCQRGHFGPGCRLTCPDANCRGYLICNLDPIGCHCAPGFTGYDCEQPCHEGHWGPECFMKCPPCLNTTCDPFSGTCEHHQPVQLAKIYLEFSLNSLTISITLCLLSMILLTYFSKLLDPIGSMNSDRLVQEFKKRAEF